MPNAKRSLTSSTHAYARVCGEHCASFHNAASVMQMSIANFLVMLLAEEFRVRSAYL